MIEIEITPEMVDKARIKAEELGTIRNSITKGKGNLVGFLGEAVANCALGGEWVNTYDYDLVLKDGTKVDVKSKTVTSVPQGHYDCSVAALNTKQKCDAYAFVRIKKDLSAGWYLGILEKDAYLEQSVYLHAGDVDPSNNFQVRSNCYNLKINQLKDTL